MPSVRALLQTTLLIVCGIPSSRAGTEAPVVEVRTPDGLAAALRHLEPGTTLRIAGGTYAGGRYVEGVKGLTVEAADPAHPPVFRGGNNGWHFSRCPDLTLRHLRVEGTADNGINLDDGGKYDHPIHGITLEDVVVVDVGPSGNHDAIKGSGLDGLTLRNCTLRGWGGQGVDLVGCHKGFITGCRLTGKPGFTATAGIQLKGGCSDIIVEKCVFEDAGVRPLNIGGSTGLAFFRPPGAKYEARNIMVRDNAIRGGECAAAFVGVEGAEFSGNRILRPRKWIFRILQETREPGFAPCGNVKIKDNRITFRRADVKVDVNIGPGTAPDTFQFESNQWFAEDRPAASRPSLPVAEKSGKW